MGPAARRALAWAVVLGTAAGATGGESASRDAAERPAPRFEYFSLDRVGDRVGDRLGDRVADRSDAGVSRSVGVCAWLRRESEGVVHIECESAFEREPGESVIVRHVEELRPEDARLVWREQCAGSGRTLLVEWTREDECLREAEWGRHQSLRETHSTARGAVMPLYLLELARSGGIASGSFTVYDPLARALESVELRTVYPIASDVADVPLDGRGDPRSATESESTEANPLREVELVRADGTLAGRYVFRGRELFAFQWQAGDLWARRITAEEYAPRIAALASKVARKP